MKRVNRSVIIFSLCAVFGVLASDDVSLPPAAASALKELDATINRAKQIAADKLRWSQQEEMKKGNLQTANLIQSKIDALIPPQAKVEQVNPSECPPTLIGKWVCSGDGVVRELRTGGEAVTARGNKGSWKVMHGKLIVKWSDGYTDTLDFPPKKGVMTGANQRGDLFSYTKQR